MSAGLKGDLNSLSSFSAKLRKLPTVVGQKVAAAAAPALTAATNETFAAGENAYGMTWSPLESGDRATLRKGGGIARGIYYVAIGTLLRVKLAVPYAKYQLGKRPVFPPQGAPLPTAYVKVLADTAARVIAAEVRA